tara:strand:+ start:163 stop:510 length:348 start_codon:yes stop_codon:yes gene_type:complete
MSNNKHYKNIKCMNTAKGSYNRRTNKFEAERDNENNIRYTNSILVTYVDTTDEFEPDQVLNSTRLSAWKEAKPQLQIAPDVDYILSEDSVNEFEATDKRPAAVSATYRPAAVFVE